MKNSKKRNFILITTIVIFLLISFYLVLVIISLNKNEDNSTNLAPEIIVNSDDTWNKIQDYRTNNNLKPFEKNEKLCIIAEDLANDTDIRKITFKDKYYNYPYRLGQVAIYNADSADDVLTEWTNTPENLEIIKKDWKYSCLVCENRNCAQIFSNL